MWNLARENIVKGETPVSGGATRTYAGVDSTSSFPVNQVLLGRHLKTHERVWWRDRNTRASRIVVARRPD
jgi:hypothetical protein